jgi:glutamate mutase epsilon subunit
MSNEHRIPEPETRARSVAKLRELVKQMDGHIANLDNLNARLEADFQKSVIGDFYRRRAERLAAQK